jgi:hypothetical protein
VASVNIGFEDFRLCNHISLAGGVHWDFILGLLWTLGNIWDCLNKR